MSHFRATRVQMWPIENCTGISGYPKGHSSREISILVEDSGWALLYAVPAQSIVLIVHSLFYAHLLLNNEASTPAGIFNWSETPSTIILDVVNVWYSNKILCNLWNMKPSIWEPFYYTCTLVSRVASRVRTLADRSVFRQTLLGTSLCQLKT